MAYMNNYSKSPYSPNGPKTNSDVQTSPYTQSGDYNTPMSGVQLPDDPGQDDWFQSNYRQGNIQTLGAPPRQPGQPNQPSQPAQPRQTTQVIKPTPTFTSGPMVTPTGGVPPGQPYNPVPVPKSPNMPPEMVGLTSQIDPGPPAPTGTNPPAAGGTPPATTPVPVSAANGDIKRQIEQYFAARGVNPNPDSVNYWTQKWNEFGAKDPAYFNQRLGLADEFTPVGGGIGQTFAPPTGLMNQQYGLISQLMGSGGPITPEVMAMMNGQNQATNAQATKDAMEHFNRNAAGRGVFTGGTAEAMRQKLLAQGVQNQLTGQRSVGIAAPTTNFNALIQALTSGQGVIGANNALGFNYNNANATLEQQFANWLMNGNYGA
jgi:hypothetical protein